jgi:hypothetical protein
VSLLTVIIQSLGPGSVPFVVAGTVFGVFELGERLASQRAKDALSRWLLSFDIQKAKALPDGTQEIFERIFGERHFSWKCFVRSAIFSLGATAFILVLLFLIYPKETSALIATFFQGFWLWITEWLLWSILIDYVSLFKTRLILRIISSIRRQITLIAVAIVCIDYIAYKLIFGVSLILFEQIVSVIQLGVFIRTNTPEYLLFRAPFIPHGINWYFVWFWSGFVPSLWMWLYAVALVVTRTILRSEKLVNWLRWFLDVEKNPFRSIGAVAAALAFIASVAIILVSAEVSRIGGGGVARG